MPVRMLPEHPTIIRALPRPPQASVPDQADSHALIHSRWDPNQTSLFAFNAPLLPFLFQ